MAGDDVDDDYKLPTHVINYDYDNPSPLFSKEQADYIESIRQYFSDEDLKKIRKIECFRLNLYAGLIETAIPGLRYKEGMDFLYVRKFSNEKYTKMMDIFLDHVYQYFPEEDVDRCYMPGFRIKIPEGDHFYPFVFHGNLEKWQKRLNETAKYYQTLTGKFDHGSFILSNGQSISFCVLNVDIVRKRPYPEDW